MLTPEQLESVSFGKKFGGGYNTEDVDSFHKQLFADYITLYNENASLRSKMRVLVTKLEEYRNAEISMKEAMINTQKNCDAQLAETEKKCASMIRDAEAAAIEADKKIAAEEDRVEQARLCAARQILELKSQLENCLQLLSEIQDNHRPSGPIEEPVVEETPVAAPPVPQEQAPKKDPVTEKFSNLQFGRNYDPENR
jgi:cell division initiation protein